MSFFIISAVGLVFAYRISQQFEKIYVLNKSHYMILNAVITTPILILQFFKEHKLVLLLYIGMILIFLILDVVFFEKKQQNLFEKTHLKFLNDIILQIKIGRSPVSSFKMCFESLKESEKVLYQPCFNNFSMLKVTHQRLLPFILDYNQDLIDILSAQNRVVEQLLSFRSRLKVIYNFKTKTELAAQPIKAQLIVALMVYLLILSVSITQLSLLDYPRALICSLVLMTLGIYMILTLGRGIKWPI